MNRELPKVMKFFFTPQFILRFVCLVIKSFNLVLLELWVDDFKLMTLLCVVKIQFYVNGYFGYNKDYIVQVYNFVEKKN